MEKYEKLEKLGEGTYGKVYKAIEKETGKLVALKKSKLEMHEQGVPSTALREIALLNRLSQSLYVVRLLGVEHVTQSKLKSVSDTEPVSATEPVSDTEPVSQRPKSSLYLVFEYLDTDLSKFIASYRTGTNITPLERPLVQRFMFQLCLGMDHCHSHAVLHRDLKPQNLLVDKDKYVLKIADFGLGRGFNLPLKALTHEIATLWYRAPEVLLGSTHYSTAVDMWSVGCIFAEMVRVQPLFAGDSEFRQLLQIFSLLGTPTEQTWPGVTSLRDWHNYPKWDPKDLSLAVPSLTPEGVDLLSKMLTYNPRERIEAKTALEHPYFHGLDKSQF